MTQHPLADALRALEPYFDAIACYASTMGEHEPNKLIADARKALAQYEKSDTDRDQLRDADVNAMANVLMAAWAKAEPEHPVTKHPASFVATFADMARAALASKTAQPDRDQLREVLVLKGIGKINGDGWKDTTRIGEVVFAWNEEKPPPYCAGQYPRIGCENWSASVEQYDFVPASRDDLPAILTALASKTAIDPATVEACGNCADLQATIDRVRLALDFIEPRNESERNAAIDADLTAGMSLRKTAEKHGTTFGIVRGRARALGKDQ